MKTLFQHTILERHMFNEPELFLSRSFSVPFGLTSKGWFDRIIKQYYPKSRKVKDSTIAGYYWVTFDGTKSFELH